MGFICANSYRFVKFGMWWDNYWKHNTISCEVHLNSRNSDNFPKEGIQVSLEVKLGCEGNNAYFYETKSDGMCTLTTLRGYSWVFVTNFDLAVPPECAKRLQAFKNLGSLGLA